MIPRNALFLCFKAASSTLVPHPFSFGFSVKKRSLQSCLKLPETGVYFSRATSGVDKTSGTKYGGFERSPWKHLLAHFPSPIAVLKPLQAVVSSYWPEHSF